MAGCYEASVAIREACGWPAVAGLFDPDPFDESPPRLFGHCWNIMPDGRIWDATASQFGLPEPFVTCQENPLYQMEELIP